MCLRVEMPDSTRGLKDSGDLSLRPYNRSDVIVGSPRKTRPNLVVAMRQIELSP